MNATTQSDIRLIVQRIPAPVNRFILTVLEGNEIRVVVTADSAQKIKDCIEAEWPVGTRVQWLVI